MRVVGRYALYNEIAAGGMATVHVGRLLGPVGFARTVAIKRLHAQYAKDPEFVSMFLDEARLAARVQHPNVVATIDVVATDGELFLIMDYVRGESLSKLGRMAKKNGERVPLRVATAIMCGFMHGLHAAHEAKNERGEALNLVHRDVSPQNVLVGADGIPRVLDFGVAKAQGRIQVTRDGQIKGKLAYMPPEQLAGREVTRAVDVYASGVVLWETLTGERLFKGENEAQTLSKILNDPVVPPSVIVSGIPPGLDAAILKALSRDPRQRQATAKQFALELERCVGMASPTEVGEWVEAVVGPTLSAREEEIAEIESHSASIRVTPSGRFPTESQSDTTLGAPGQRQMSPIPAAGDSIPVVLAGHDATAIDRPQEVTRPFNMASADESQSKSKVTGSFVALPVERRLPIVASVIGVIILFAIVLVVILRKDNASSTTPTSASSVPADPRTAVPPPEESAASIAFSAAPPVEAETPPPVATTTTKPPPQPTSQPTVTTHPTTRPTTSPPMGKGKDCDPPWTYDANGRKKYKLECM